MFHVKHRLPVAILLTFSLITSCKQKKQADLILFNANIYTSTDDTAKNTCIAIKNGLILAIGNDEILGEYEAKEKKDLESATIYPGFIDAHCHFTNYGLDKYKCKLFFTKSFAEVLIRIKEYDKTNQYTWIYGRGWDQNDWEIKEFPDNAELNRLHPDKPVILKRIDGHAMLVNQKALDLAGITTATKIEGGLIEIKNGKLTGILVDNAMDPIENIVAAVPEKDMVARVKEAENDCYKNGLTSVVDCGLTLDLIEFLRKLYKEKTLSISNTALISQDKKTLQKYLAAGPFKEPPLYVTAIKIYADGALGSRGAALLKEYSDQPGHYGLILSPIDEMRKIAKEAKWWKWQLCTHAIGDSANRAILRLYAEILKGKNDLRWRIEHSQVVDNEDYTFFNKYLIIPSVQPTHAISDMPWAPKRLGKDRIHSAYAFKRLLNEAGTIALGTDFPVEEINPLATFYTAVARKDKDGKPAEGFMKENALSRMEALKGMTIWAAHSVFRETETGSLEKGKHADIVILDKDIMKVPEEDILKAQVLYTIQRGEIKYDRSKK